MSEWQDISTAPTDELVGLSDGTQYSTGILRIEIWEAWDLVSETRKELRKTEHKIWEFYGPDDNLYPTHWQPLPAPPADGESMEETIKRS